MENDIRASVSKIDIERFKDFDEFEKYKLNDDLSSFSKYVQTKLSEYGAPCAPFVGKDYHIYLYCKGNEVNWKSFVEYLVDIDYIQGKDFYTKHPSFIFLKKMDPYIFCITSGLGSNIIQDFQDRLFGLEIITKLVEKDDRIIRQIADKRVYGKRSKLMIFNRRKTNFVDEENFESILNDIGTSLNKEIYNKLGISSPVDKENKETNRDIIVDFGASIKIGKNIDYSELNLILGNIKKYLDKDKYNFVINYLVPVQYMGYTQTKIWNEFIDVVKFHPEIVHLGYDTSINDCISKDSLKNSNGGNIKEKIFEELNVDEINNVYDLEDFCIRFIKTYQTTSIINSYSVLIENAGSEQAYKIYNLLDLEFEYDNHIVYLVEGTWYIFLSNYNNFLNDKYKEIYESSSSFCKKIFCEGKIDIDIKSCSNENELKKHIQNHDFLIDGDMRYYSRVEIADAIFLSDDSIYLLHNKKSFNGSGMRDVTGQISASAGFISDLINRKYDQLKIFHEYIERLKTKNKGKEDSIDRLEKEILENTEVNIVFIAVFTEDIDLETHSSSIKFLLETTSTELSQYNFKLYIY